MTPTRKYHGDYDRMNSVRIHRGRTNIGTFAFIHSVHRWIFQPVIKYFRIDITDNS